MRNADDISKEDRQNLERIVIWSDRPLKNKDPLIVKWCVVYMDSFGVIYSSSEKPSAVEIELRAPMYRLHATTETPVEYPDDRRMRER